MLSITRFAPDNAQPAETLSLPYEQRLKSRQLLALGHGQTVHCVLPPGTCLRHGDRLLVEGEDARQVVLIEAAPEPLIEARAKGGLHFACAAYHLGNRHVKVEIGEDQHGQWLRFQPDHVLEAMLLGLGCTLAACLAPFQPEGGAYGGHSHQAHHHHEHPGHDQKQRGPKIHAFGS